MKKEKLIMIIITILILSIFIIVFLKDSSTTSENELNKTQIINLIISQQTQGLETESISECFQDTKRYYYVNPECCDGLNPIYDNKGDYLCSLGGFTGRGDGSCPSSLNLTNCTKVWEND